MKMKAIFMIVVFISLPALGVKGGTSTEKSEILKSEQKQKIAMTKYIQNLHAKRADKNRKPSSKRRGK